MPKKHNKDSARAAPQALTMDGTAADNGFLPPINAAKPFAVSSPMEGPKVACPTTADLKMYKKMILQQYQSMMDTQKPFEPDDYVPMVSMLESEEEPEPTVTFSPTADGSGLTPRRSSAYNSPVVQFEPNSPTGSGYTKRRGSSHPQNTTVNPEAVVSEIPVEVPEWFEENELAYQSGEFEAVRQDVLGLKPMGPKACRVPTPPPKPNKQKEMSKAIEYMHQDESRRSQKTDKALAARQQYLVDPHYAENSEPALLLEDEVNDRQLLYAKESIDRNIIEVTLLKFMTILNEEGSGHLTAMYTIHEGEYLEREGLSEDEEVAQEVIWKEFQVRTRILERKLEDRSASRIQAGARGYQARKQVKQKREEMNGAATKIQAGYRGHQTRSQMRRAREEWQINIRALVMAEDHVRIRLLEEHSQEEAGLWQQLIALEQARLLEAQEAYERQKAAHAEAVRFAMESDAALKIQTNYRRHSAHHTVEQMREERQEFEAALKIQTNYRRHSAYLTVEQMREEERQEALRMQQRQREEEELAAIRIQSSYRRMSAVNVAHQKRMEVQIALEAAQAEESAAVKIQSHVRRRSAVMSAKNRRLELERQLEIAKAEELAAIRIQSQVRRRSAVHSARARREELRQLEEERNQAAIKIQSQLRRRSAVLETDRIRRQLQLEAEQAEAEQAAATRIQCQYRRHSAMVATEARRRSIQRKLDELQEQEAAATKIQSQVRMRSASRYTQQLRQERADRDAAATKIQSRYRGYRGRVLARQSRQEHEAASCIQRGYRCHRSRSTVDAMRAEQELDEEAERRSEYGEDFEAFDADLEGVERRGEEDADADEVQAVNEVVEQRTPSQDYDYMRESKRLEHGLNQFEMEEMAAIKIQTQYRGHAARVEMKKRRQDISATKIQSSWRGRQDRKLVQEMRENQVPLTAEEQAVRRRKIRRRNIYDRARLEDREEEARRRFPGVAAKELGSLAFYETLERTYRNFLEAWERTSRSACLDHYAPHIKAVKELARDYYLREVDPGRPAYEYLNACATKIQATFRGMSTRNKVWEMLQEEEQRQDNEDRMVSEVALFFKEQTEGRALTPDAVREIVRWYEALPPRIQKTVALEEVFDKGMPELTDVKEPPRPDHDEAGFQSTLNSQSLRTPKQIAAPAPPMQQRQSLAPRQMPAAGSHAARHAQPQKQPAPAPRLAKEQRLVPLFPSPQAASALVPAAPAPQRQQQSRRPQPPPASYHQQQYERPHAHAAANYGATVPPRYASQDPRAMGHYSQQHPQQYAQQPYPPSMPPHAAGHAYHGAPAGPYRGHPQNPGYNAWVVSGP